MQTARQITTRSVTVRARYPHGVRVRLMLALILMLAPVVSAAQWMPLQATADVGAETEQMPCHTGPAVPETEPQPACPHCSADGPLTSCKCCDQTAPAWLAFVLASTHSVVAVTSTLVWLGPDTPPPSPAERLYRPPIRLA